jgi:hypothetical protein
MALAEDLREREKPLLTPNIGDIIQALQFTIKESRTFLLLFLSPS